jgi:chromosome segregation ATPase
MNTNEQKITPLKNSEEMEKLIQDLKSELAKEKQETLTWKNSKIKTEQELFVKEKEAARLNQEVEDWKREASAARRVQAESKQTQATNDFNTEFIKLQQKKGWAWDEAQGWVKAN